MITKLWAEDWRTVNEYKIIIILWLPNKMRGFFSCLAPTGFNKERSAEDIDQSNWSQGVQWLVHC